MTGVTYAWVAGRRRSQSQGTAGEGACGYVIRACGYVIRARGYVMRACGYVSFAGSAIRQS
ncbi:MAG TPA: hypothetical protein VFU76_03925 [Terriglobales bacterium]|nr:hypothetical protein [Terriglobales bacterium]